LGLLATKRAWQWFLPITRKLIQSLRMPYSADQLLHYVRKRFPEREWRYVYEVGATGLGLHDDLVAGG